MSERDGVGVAIWQQGATLSRCRSLGAALLTVLVIGCRPEPPVPPLPLPLPPGPEAERPEELPAPVEEVETSPAPKEREARPEAPSRPVDRKPRERRRRVSAS